MASNDIGGSVNPNPNPRNGSNDVNINITRRIGDEKANAAAGVFAAGNDHRALNMGTVGAFGNVNANGHGVGMEVSHTPKYNMTTATATATANLWTSANKTSSVNLNANASQHLSGPMRGHQNFGGALIYKRTF